MIKMIYIMHIKNSDNSFQTIEYGNSAEEVAAMEYKVSECEYLNLGYAVSTLFR